MATVTVTAGGVTAADVITVARSSARVCPRSVNRVAFVSSKLPSLTSASSTLPGRV